MAGLSGCWFDIGCALRTITRHTDSTGFQRLGARSAPYTFKMPEYRRITGSHALWFFTVVTQRRQPVLCGATMRDALRDALESVRARYPFEIDAMVLMPDHLHTIWRLPLDDVDYARRWSLCKAAVTKATQQASPPSSSHSGRNEGSLWQRRFWAHAIVDDRDYERHADYIHFNPVKHGLVSSVKDWPHSSFHRWMREGRYDLNWANNVEGDDERFGE